MNELSQSSREFLKNYKVVIEIVLSILIMMVVTARVF